VHVAFEDLGKALREWSHILLKNVIEFSFAQYTLSQSRFTENSVLQPPSEQIESDNVHENTLRWLVGMNTVPSNLVCGIFLPGSCLGVGLANDGLLVYVNLSAVFTH